MYNIILLEKKSVKAFQGENESGCSISLLKRVRVSTLSFEIWAVLFDSFYKNCRSSVVTDKATLTTCGRRDSRRQVIRRKDEENEIGFSYGLRHDHVQLNCSSNGRCSEFRLLREGTTPWHSTDLSTKLCQTSSSNFLGLNPTTRTLVVWFERAEKRKKQPDSDLLCVSTNRGLVSLFTVQET